MLIRPLPPCVRKKEFLIINFLSLIVSLVGAVFVYAGFKKMAAPLEFADAIMALDVFPVSWSAVVAIWVIALELILGTMLIVNCCRKVSVMCSAILLLMFLFVLVQAMLRGLKVECGCFSAKNDSGLNELEALGRDCVLLGGLLWVVWKDKYVVDDGLL